MELRVRDGRAVLAGEDPSGDHQGEREVDPHSLPLGADLAEALHEWAKVADAVVRTETPADGVASALVTRRGKQLAGRIAAVMNTPVRYTDPVSGELVSVEAPEAHEAVEAVDEPSPVRTLVEEEPEPTPWGTGLTVTVITAAIVTVTVVSLSLGLGETSLWLALVANVLVVGGLAPSVWLGRNVPVWRWVAYGVVTGVLVAWFALILTLL